MPETQTAVTLTMLAMIAGLLLFAVLLLLGARIVRWLRLPQDLPEGPRFEPPPPPLATTVSRAVAATVASEQAALRALYTQAHEAVRAAMEVHECHQYLSTAGTDPAILTAAQAAAHAQASAATACTSVEQALVAFDTQVRRDRADAITHHFAGARTAIADQAVIIQSALVAARAAVAPHLGDQGNRRLIIMVVLLIVMIAWVVYMQTFLKH